MSLIIKKNTTFKIPRTGSTAPAGIDVANTSQFIFNSNVLGSRLLIANGKYEKVSPIYYNIGYNAHQIKFATTWNYYQYDYLIYTNTSATNPLVIPYSGWETPNPTFYTTSNPVIPLSTNSFYVTSASGNLWDMVGYTMTKRNSTTWISNNGAENWTLYLSEETFYINYYDGKYTATRTQARTISSGIPLVGWSDALNIVFTPLS
jgi:hypothetical protein